MTGLSRSSSREVVPARQGVFREQAGRPSEHVQAAALRLGLGVMLDRA
jgi:hypothetical protein